MAYMRHMYPDLVGPPGPDLDPEKGISRILLKHRIVRQRIITALSHDPFLLSGEFPLDRNLYDPFRLVKFSLAESVINLPSDPFLRLIVEPCYRRPALRKADESGCVLVQTADRADLVRFLFFLKIKSQPVRERIGKMSVGRMHDDPCRLIQTDQILVLVDDLYLRVRRDDLIRSVIRENNAESIPLPKLSVYKDILPVDRDPMVCFIFCAGDIVRDELPSV